MENTNNSGNARTNVIIHEDKCELLYRNRDAVDVILYFAKEITQYCKSTVQRKFDSNDPRDQFYMKQAKNIMMLYHFYKKGEVKLTRKDIASVRESISYASKKFKNRDFLSLVPHSLSIEVKEQVNSVTLEIIKRLKSNGFIVFKRVSSSTPSQYLMLDNRVLKLVRVSNHESCEMDYKYNVIVKQGTQDDVKIVKNEKGYSTYYIVPGVPYNFIVNRLIQDILEDKQSKIKQLGKITYNKMVYGNKEEVSLRSYKEV